MKTFLGQSHSAPSWWFLMATLIIYFTAATSASPAPNPIPGRAVYNARGRDYRPRDVANKFLRFRQALNTPSPPMATPSSVLDGSSSSPVAPFPANTTPSLPNKMVTNTENTQTSNDDVSNVEAACQNMINNNPALKNAQTTTMTVTSVSTATVTTTMTSACGAAPAGATS